MNKMHSLARVVLAGFAGYFGVILIMNLLRGIAMLSMKREVWRFNIGMFLSVFLTIAFTVTVIYLILRYLDKLAGKIVGTANLTQEESQVDWLGVLFHLLCICVGLLFLLYFFSGLGSIIQISGISVEGRFSPRVSVRGYYLLGHLVLLAAGIYLLCGAPHFVRWQIRKVKQLSQEFSAEHKLED